MPTGKVAQSRPIQPDGRLHGVVVAVRRQDGRLLMIRRAADLRAGGQVCFPGGAVELGEDPAEAVRREMREELGLELTSLELVWEWEAPSARLRLRGYVAGWEEQQIRPDPREVAEVLWLTAIEGANHPQGMPTNRDFIAAVERRPLGNSVHRQH
jgi:mutator protein MutT